MPKELIRSTGPAFVRNDKGDELIEWGPGESHRILQRVVWLRWGRDRGYVELGAVEVDTATNEHSEPFRGMFLNLDRAGINKLVRDLRTARDQAFGRDE